MCVNLGLRSKRRKPECLTLRQWLRAIWNRLMVG